MFYVKIHEIRDAYRIISNIFKAAILNLLEEIDHFSTLLMLGNNSLESCGFGALTVNEGYGFVAVTATEGYGYVV